MPATGADPIRVILGDKTKGPWSATFYSSPTTVDNVRSITLTESRDSPFGVAGTATATIVIDDDAGDYDPSNPSATWYDALKKDFGLQLEVSDDDFATDTVLMFGYLDDVIPEWDSARRVTTLAASNGIRVLGQYSFEDTGTPFFQHEFTGQRVDRILNRVDWPGALRATVDDGRVMVPPADGTGNALDMIRDLARTEGGYLAMTPGGVIEYHRHNPHIHQTRMSVSQVTFSDQGTAGHVPILWRPVMTTVGRFRRVDRVTATGYTGRPYEAGTVPADWPPATRDETGLLAYFDADVRAVAHHRYLAWKSHRGFPAQIAFNVWPDQDNTALVAVCDLKVQVGNRVTVIVDPPGHPATRTYNATIEGYSHQIDRTGDGLQWVCTLTLGNYDALPAAGLAWGDAFTSSTEPTW